MAKYLYQAAYTPEGWAQLVKTPQDRSEGIRAAIEKLGGKIESFHMSFGEYDVAVIVDMPDNVTAAGFAIAAAAGGAVKAVKTTPLMTVAESLEAMRKAGMAGYRAPAAA